MTVAVNGTRGCYNDKSIVSAKLNFIDGTPTFSTPTFENNRRRSQQLAEEVAAGAQTDRKVYQIHNKDLVKFLGKDQEALQNIHRIKFHV
ncbi:hypothetical protein L6452_07480 [Arctium lappa]|uniref:Uncharacterized protein n=1 Tax=Arctium lappa TaxID=4217 RepID=A0ACB9EKX3_ARCLA|nr:hypothetical protein L6452_07480 [Arctium lappa]